MSKETRSKILFWSVEILIIATLILVSTKINFVFKPITTFFSTLFLPILIAGFLYYITNPFINTMEKFKIKRPLGIAIVFLLLIGLFALSISKFIPSLMAQLVDLSKNIPAVANDIQHWTINLSHAEWVQNLNVDEYLKKFDISIAKTIKTALANISAGIGSIVSSIASVAVMVVTIPFILFYMLKDGNRVAPGIQRMLPESMREDASNLLHQLNETLASYISGQAVECLFVAICTFLGYKIIDIKYAFLFAVIAGATNMIPYLGPYLGLAPAMIVTVFDSPWKSLLCALVVLIVQQIDSNIIYPNVIGKSLDIHPLTIIIILLVAGNISGVMGMMLGVPFYAIVKVIVKYIYQIIQLHQQQR